MPETYKNNYINHYFKLHRIFYVVLLGVIISCKVKGLTTGTINLIYYIPVIVGSFLLDELYIRKKDRIPEKYQSLRIMTEIFLLSLGNLFGPPHPIQFISVLLFEFILCFEDMLLLDIFDDYHIFIRRVFYMSFIVLGMIACFRYDISGAWIFIGIITGIFVVGAGYIIFHSYIDGIKYYEKRATDIYFTYKNLEDDRDKLKVYQDRVEAVNNEINIQKLNLEKANQDLENMNREVRSLINVMQFFTTSFDVPQNAREMMENIMEMKNPIMCGIYINKGVYLNDLPFMDIITGNPAYQSSLARDFATIFEKVRTRSLTEPFILCKNKVFTEGVLSDTQLSSIVAFPAVENNQFCGVMVVASGNYDFFSTGYSFYESSMIDFMAALRSTKLYLQMQDMAHKDGLTGIYNRAYFNEIFTKICANSIVNEKTLAVAMMDIDKFKSINDTYGHLAGDEVIRTVAAVDAHFARKYNGYAVRYGGEEFLLIVQGVTVQEFRDILEDMHDEIIRSVVHYEGQDIHINTSVGMSQFPDIAEEVVDVLDQSDQAMYFSKEHGRGMVVIYGREEESLPKE